MIKRAAHITFIAMMVWSIPFEGKAQTDVRFYDYPQNHLDWYTIESDHFLIHFQEGNSRSAQIASRIAEEIYHPINELYQYVPDEKVSIVLKDREDYSNGAAYFFENKIDIWLPALETPLRGTHNWLRNVITHEYVHIVQIQKGMKRNRKIPALYLQWLSYEDVRRPDVLYGFPNGIVTLPFASVNIPAWLAEGTAQYQTAGLLYDTWDSHRDMILRTRILSDSYFTLEEMNTFASKNTLERETVYNQGFAFVIYLASRFGDPVLREITEALAKKKVYHIKDAIEMATGVSGDIVFQDWVADRKTFYRDAVAELKETRSKAVETMGFFNFYPRTSPNDSSLAYLSNKGYDHGLMSLYIKDREGNHTEVASLGLWENRESYSHLSALEPVLNLLETSYSFSPDSKKITYSINKKNKYGERYRDIFIYDLETKKKERLTHSARIQYPSWNHKGDAIAAIQYKDGTQNLVLLHPSFPDSVQSLTQFRHGENLFTPVWDENDNRIYFAMSHRGNRDLMAFDVQTQLIAPVMSDPNIDYRDPAMGPDNNYLYYTANPDGIFNIYRIPLAGGQPQKLTSVIGGAFMPHISSQDTLYFSEYEAGGYRIRSASLDDLVRDEATLSSYNPDFPEGLDIPDMDFSYIEKLNDFNETDLLSFPEAIRAIADTGSYEFTFNTIASDSLRSYRSYKDTYSGFSFFPLLRFDNYSQPNGSNGRLLGEAKFGKLGKNLLRDVKPGIYFSSRDVIDRLSIFGGLMLGVASQPAETVAEFFRPDRLINLDRDAFLIMEHRGLPFIKRSWSPTVAVEIYNLRRNVKDGLAIEEFPCTSCLPDTINTDIAYDIWQAGLFLRSKLSRRSMLELGVSYSPYRVSTEDFYSRELQQQVSGSSSQYFRGTTLSAAYTFDYYTYSNDADIAPLGLKGYLRYQYQPSKLLEEYEIEDGTLSPVFKTSKNHSTELHIRYGFKMFGEQSLQTRLRGFNYFNDPNDSFYTDYIGGFLGMRSYPYFALGGNRTAFASISWFTPLYRGINKQAGPYTLDKIYARFFFETGNGWNSPYDTGNELKSGVGAELRFAVNGYYLFPLKFFVSSSYGFDRFSLTLADDFITNSQSNKVTYGREFLFHFGVTFDFELL